MSPVLPSSASGTSGCMAIGLGMKSSAVGAFSYEVSGDGIRSPAGGVRMKLWMKFVAGAVIGSSVFVLYGMISEDINPPKHVAAAPVIPLPSFLVTGPLANSVEFADWKLDHMNGDGESPVFSGKITNVKGGASSITVGCFEGGLKAEGTLMMPEIEVGESAKADIYCTSSRKVEKVSIVVR